MSNGSAFRTSFPALSEKIHGHPLVYLDSAATTLTPLVVMDAITECYRRGLANAHRGAHTLSERASEVYEGARVAVQQWLGAEHRDEIVFTSGCTEAINLVASSWGETQLGEGDEVLVSELAHHSNWLPWQQVCRRVGARLKVLPIDGEGNLDWSAYSNALTERTKMVALTHVSNALGAISPVARMTRLAKSVGAHVLVDGAQAVGHLQVDVRGIGCDFYAFSAHKMYGPFGIGALYARRPLLESMPPWKLGGGMVRTVSLASSTFAPAPAKFEAGTPNVAGAAGFAAAIAFLRELGWENIREQEARVRRCAEDALDSFPGLQRLGGTGPRSSVISFVLEGVHPHDLSTVLDLEGVAIRAGHHCAKPTLQRLGVEATARISFAAYSTEQNIDVLVEALHKARALLLV